MCSREVNCGYTESTRNLLPDIFSEFAKKYPPTEENPRATADAYLGLDRGFDLGRIRGWYEQETYQMRGSGRMFPTVRFYLDPAHSRYWERLIGATKADKQKANFGGRKKQDGTLYAGDAWTPPGQTLEKGDRVYIVEGIFHAIALFLKGYKAIACLSSGNRGRPDRLNHSSDEALVAVNLNHFMELSRSAGQPLLDMQSLKKLLPNGKRHKFINNQSVRSKHDDRIIRCWVFTKK